MSMISNAIAFSDYRVLGELNNGNAIILDFEKKLNTFRFHKLDNKNIFMKVKTDGFSLLWDNGKIRVSLGEIIEMLQDTKSLFKVV